MSTTIPDSFSTYVRLPDSPSSPTSSSSSPSRNRRRLGLVFVTTSIISFAFLLPAEQSIRINRLIRISKPPQTVVRLPATLVGSRVSPTKGKQCSPNEFITSLLESSQLPSPPILSFLPPPPPSPPFSIPHERFSFTLPKDNRCELKRYSKEEACDLLSAFGGIWFVGDSFGRHFWSAFLMLLTGRLDGATNERATCVGEEMFDDSGKVCRRKVVKDLRMLKEEVCDGRVWARYVAAATPDPKLLKDFTRHLPHSLHSPILFSGFGPHLNYSLSSIPLYLSSISSLSRKPGGVFSRNAKLIQVWAGNHAPGKGQKEEYKVVQGPEVIKSFNSGLSGLLGEQGTVLNWYNVLEGSASPDGVHLAYRGNMEKVQVFMNFLEGVWGDSRGRGGVVEFGKREA